jgi:hypothetical protein
MVKNTGTSWHLRYWATLHLENQKELQEIATHEKHPQIRMEAVRKIKDQELLFKIAAYDTEGDIKRVAIRKILDIKHLVKLRMLLDYDFQQEIRIQAAKIQRLHDQDHTTY